MKILHTADWHLGKRLNDFSRLDEQTAVMEEICRIADEQQVDAVLIAGDIFDTFSPSNEASTLFHRTIHRLAKNGERAVIAIAGNHDSPDRVEISESLAKECGIILCGRPKQTIEPFKLDSGLEILQSEPGFIELKLPTNGTPLRLLLTPYANEVTLKQYLGEGEQKEDELRQILEEHWKELADKYCDDKGVNMLMAHLYFMQKDSVPQEEPDDEKPILHMGGAQAIYTENIPEQMQYTALGHLHRYQFVAKEPCPVVYSSSILGYSFSEENQQKFVAIVEAEAGERVKINPVKLQAGRRLKRQRFESLDEALLWLNDNPETYVELTLVSDTFIDAKTKKALFQAHDGIVTIIPELKGEKAEAVDARQQIDLTKNTRELFVDYFRHKKGQEPNEALLDLLNEIIEK
jgi:DNA repair protein SbcD/Mre11